MEDDGAVEVIERQVQTVKNTVIIPVRRFETSPPSGTLTM